MVGLSESETAWQKGLVEENCLLHGDWEVEHRATVPEKKGFGPDIDYKVIPP